MTFLGAARQLRLNNTKEPDSGVAGSNLRRVLPYKNAWELKESPSSPTQANRLSTYWQIESRKIEDTALFLFVGKHC